MAPGDSVTLRNIRQDANVPGATFVAGYNFGLLVPGPNVIPGNRGDDHRRDEYAQGARTERGGDVGFDDDQRPPQTGC